MSQPKLITKVRSLVSFEDLHRVVHACIFHHLDFGNAFYTGITPASLCRLQLIQNAAARIITGSRKQDNLTSILASLHWLFVHFHIDF